MTKLTCLKKLTINLSLLSQISVLSKLLIKMQWKNYKKRSKIKILMLKWEYQVLTTYKIFRKEFKQL